MTDAGGRFMRRAEWGVLSGLWADVLVGDAYDAHVRIKLMERAFDGVVPVGDALSAYWANPLLNATPGENSRRAAREELVRIASGFYRSRPRVTSPASP